MKDAQFKLLLASLKELTSAQLRKLSETLGQGTAAVSIAQSLDTPRPHACPRCLGTHLVRNGVHNGLKRYLCRGCSRISNAVTGTPLSGLRDKELAEDYAACMRQGLTGTGPGNHRGQGVPVALPLPQER